jgi:hypothetical protein
MTPYEELVLMLRSRGYSQSRAADRWGTEVWSRKGCPAVRVPSECGAIAAESVRVQVEKDLSDSATKRKPKSFRIRETAARKNEQIEKRRREIEVRIAERNRELGGAREVLSSLEAGLIQQKIEADERELRYLRSLITAIPGARADAGRPKARHRS